MEVPTEEIKIVYKPECYITKPVTGNQFSIGTSIPIEIRASSKSTQNILIKLYLNGDQILSSNGTNMSYSLSTSNLSINAYCISAKAFDIENNLISEEKSATVYILQ